jgi:hypothetical protein
MLPIFCHFKHPTTNEKLIIFTQYRMCNDLVGWDLLLSEAISFRAAE